MNRLQANIFEFAGKPFKDGLNAVFYEPDQKIPKESMYLVRKAVSQVEAEARRPSVATQFYSSICCVPVNLARLKEKIVISDGQNEISWSKGDVAKLHPNETNGKEVLKRLIAKAISNQQIARGWFVEAYRHVYYWSFNLTEQLSMGVMDVYPGFVFIPYVYEDGSCAVLIDPRFRFVPRKNYRDIVDELRKAGKTKDEISSILEGETVIDACPIIHCQLRKTPLSICRLKGAGRRRFLAKLDFAKTPSNANYHDLVEYHKRKEVCPNKGLLGKSIKDVAPIALIEAPNLDKPLEFPLERLRKELKLHELDKIARLLVMKYIRPSMKDRWYLTKGFMSYVDDVKIGRLFPLRLIRRFAEAGSKDKPWAYSDSFNESPLRFAAKKRGLEPYVGLETHGPYDLEGKRKRWFNEIYITLYNLSPLKDEELRHFYNDLVEGFSYRPSFVGMRKLFRVNIPRFTKDVVQRKLRESRSRLRKQPHIAVIITQLTGDRNIRQYKPYKQELTRNGIPCQFVLDKNIISEVSISKYSGYLKNVALSVYAKIGGIPWILDRSVGELKCFVGLASIIRKKNVFMSAHVFDHYGKWLGGWTEQVSKERYPRALESKLNDAKKNFSRLHGEPKQVVLHKDGEIWSDLEMKAIDHSLGSDRKIVCVKKLGMPRIYDVASIDYLVKRGSYVQTASNEAFLVTSGPPHQIRGSQQPITVEIKHPKPSPSLMRETCMEVFQLSLVYGGYTLAVTSKPITTHFASRAVGLAAKHQLQESPKMWRKAWFL